MKNKFTPKVVLLLAALVLIIVIHGFSAELPLKVSPPMFPNVSNPPLAPGQVKSPQHLTIRAVPNHLLTNLSPTNDWAKNHPLTNNPPATNQ